MESRETVYWLDLFTGTTWDEFLEAGGLVSGFSARKRATVQQVQPGDVLLCYMTGVMRWVGALRVVGPSFDKSAIWSYGDFPERLNVEVIIALPAEQGIPMVELEGKVAFYEGSQDAGKFKAFLRGSPKRFQRDMDGDLILKMLHQAKSNPSVRPVDPRKLSRKPLFSASQRKGKQIVETVVSVPDFEPDGFCSGDVSVAVESSEQTVSKHTEIQYQLLLLGSEMGFDVWVARNDRSRIWNGQVLSKMSQVVDSLPTQFNEATNRTIELIDVLWLHGNSIVAAFEIESTTSIYSGLLRMSDLLALQPNLEINLFLVAPEERRGKVEQEILRPTFKLRSKPLSNICGFIGFDDLVKRLELIRSMNLAKSLKPDFLKEMAEYFG